MAAADIYCQPNTGPEPFGVAFVEALYTGLPVVTTGFGGATEIVDETCGMLTPPEDGAAVAAALRALITASSRRELVAAGRARAAALCDPAVRLQRLAALISSPPSRTQGTA